MTLTSILTTLRLQAAALQQQGQPQKQAAAQQQAALTQIKQKETSK